MGSFRIVALVLVIEGCYAPGYRDCEIECAGEICPSGLACVDNRCRLGPVSQSCEAVLGDARLDSSDDGPGPDVDSDGDRVLDVDDNCDADPNPLQENEDGDALGDACDPCPIYATYGPGNTLDANADGDGDGVGDGCDPHPNLNTDRALLFEGFNTTPSGTIASGIAFNISGGAATATVGANEAANLAFVVPGFDPNHKLYVFTRETILAYSAATLKASGAALFSDPTAGVGTACGPGAVGTASGQVSLVSFSPTGDSQQAAATATTSVGTVIDSRLQRGGSSQSIVCSSPTGDLNGPMPQPPVAIGIHAWSMNAAFRYVYLVDSP